MRREQNKRTISKWKNLRRREMKTMRCFKYKNSSNVTNKEDNDLYLKISKQLS